MTQTSKPQTLTPAISVSLTGKYLIEASAGTGKTWTLTGIMLRLIIEARRAPEQIIATTFTRDAAAEMRERVHARLLDFYQVVQWIRTLPTVHQATLSQEVKDILYPAALQVIPATADDNLPSASDSNNKLAQPDTPKLSADALNKLREDRNQWLINHPKPNQLKDSIKDPINLHLIGYLLDHTTTYSLDEAIRRTALVLTTLDKLFVGTLDSLAQKWLSEYSSETGYQQGMAIVEDGESGHIVDSIIHDELRRFQSQLHYNSPRVYDLLEQQGKLTTIDDHRGAVKKALMFMSAPIDAVESVDKFDFDKFEATADKFASLDFADLDPFYNEDYRKSQGFNARSSINTRFAYINEIQQQADKHGMYFEQYISDDAKKLFIAIKESQYANDEGKIKHFKTKHETQHRNFHDLEVIKTLNDLYDLSDALKNHLQLIITNLNRHIAQTVRQKLPIILEEKGQTTFSLQMVRLNQALLGRQGDKLARYIRHHYPVALIDESQDINGEQAQMIKRIYLSGQLSEPLSQPLSKLSAPNNKQNAKDNEDKGFLLLVGDPKQAIYGFRGGDVANYNDMKRLFNPQNRKTLDENRRSNRPLINALNHWFGCPNAETNLNDSQNEGQDTSLLPLSNLGEDIDYQHITAFNEHPKLSWLMDLTNSDSVKDADSNQSRNQNQNNDNDSLLPSVPIGLLHLPYDTDPKYDEYETTAMHIATLLNSNQSLDGKPIEPKNIAVLGRRRQDLKQVEDMLVKLGIPTLKTSDVNIFETTMATDIGALIAVMLQPYRHDMINRILTSHLYGLCLDEVRHMMQSHVRHDEIRHNSIAQNDNETISSTNHQTQRNSYQDFIAYVKKGAQRWHDYGILSALHYLLDTTIINNVGVWQTLARLENGDRHIMDLRHVMDIISEYSLTMREHELLAWYREQMENPPSADWAKQHPLPTESGVRLMTIHKSKGLEFPIVYVIGLDNDSRKVDTKHALYLYNNSSANNDHANTNANHQHSLQRRLSPQQGTLDSEDYYVAQANNEDYQEFKRLGYVAFTRASEQLYLVVKDNKPVNSYNKLSTEQVIRDKYPRNPMKRWLFSREQYVIPDYLQGKVADISNLDLLYHMVEESRGKVQNDTQSAGQQDKQALLNTQQSETIDYSHSQYHIHHNSVIGWAKTSFTALARQLDDSTQAVAVMDERIDDAIDINVDIVTTIARRGNHTDNTLTLLDNEIVAKLDAVKPSDDIRFTFVKGANAGTFLHEIFEKIDFNLVAKQGEQAQWSQVIDRSVSSYQLPIVYASQEHQDRLLNNERAEKSQLNQENEINKLNNAKTPHDELKNWISEVLATPMRASNQALKDIPRSHRLAEMGFNMGLADTFAPEHITALFQKYLPNDPDKHVHLSAQYSSHLYRYLRGEIDLVYQHAGKFYVVDYKSNYLGDSLSNYDESTLNTAMSKAGYWLQACIYQVALHRFLSMRIADYMGNEANYLGAVEYVFLRGTYSTDDGTRYGLVTWDIPIDFVKALDKVFGRAM